MESLRLDVAETLERSIKRDTVAASGGMTKLFAVVSVSEYGLLNGLIVMVEAGLLELMYHANYCSYFL